jgi:hypothetical protein
LRLKKHDFKHLKVLDIQSMLARDYNYAKWDLIETMEIEFKLLKSLGLHQSCRDLIEKLYSQQLCISTGVNFEEDFLTYFDAI